jgi:hypothetical protein
MTQFKRPSQAPTLTMAIHSLWRTWGTSCAKQYLCILTITCSPRLSSKVTAYLLSSPQHVEGTPLDEIRAFVYEQ